MRLLSHFATLCLVVCLSAFTSAAEIHVPGDQPTIQAAIEAAALGDTIVVSPGRYNEKIDFLGKAITLRSANPLDPDVVAATILDGSDLQWWCVSFTNGEKEDSVIEGFTVTGTAQGGGIFCKKASPMIVGNTFRGNDASPGIACLESAAFIAGNLFALNEGMVTGGAIDCHFSTVLITGNKIIRLLRLQSYTRRSQFSCSS